MLRAVNSFQPAFPAEAVIDLAAFRHNLQLLRQTASGSAQLAVIKADAYGHGLVPMALAALENGVAWLGVAQLAEAMVLREALDRQGVARPEPGNEPTGERPRIFSWILNPDDNLSASIEAAIKADIDLSVSLPSHVLAAATAARAVGRPARIHLKIDTGMSRAGSTLRDFPVLVAAVLQAAADGLVEPVALWSHFSSADDPSDRGEGITRNALQIFEQATQICRDENLDLPLRHISATSGILWHPEAHFDLVRNGIGMYGLSPDYQVATSANLGLRPVMTLRARLISVKTIEPGTSTSYGAQWQAPTRRLVALVPVGYADGIDRGAWQGVDSFGVPRTAAGVSLRGSDGKWHRCQLVGKVCMDQFIVDLGDADDPNNPLRQCRVGDWAVVWGDATRGHISADDWARAIGTINYEVTTRLGSRVPRRYVQDFSELEWQ